MNKKEKILIILGIIFISFNLRAPITAVGSVVEMIKTDYSLTSSMAGFITTLPLIAFAIVSPFVARVTTKFGYGKTVFLGLFFILLGELIRSYTTRSGLFLGTLLLGIGIAVGNVLIPSIIKLKFPQKIGFMTSIYIVSMCIFAALGAGISVPLASGLSFGWKNSLASWAILTIVTLLIWLPQLKGKKAEKSSTINLNKKASENIWKSSLAWFVTLFMGIQSLIFYSLVAWLATIVVAKGMTAVFAGNMALLFQLVGIPSALIIPIFCDRVRNQRGLVLLTCLFYLSGLFLFLIGSTKTIITLAVLLMALGQGAGISLAIAFISLRSSNARIASKLSGMSQSVGYLIAAVGPILIGSIYDYTNNWSIPLTIFLFLTVLLLFAGFKAGNDLVIEE